jgi:integrase
VGEIATKNYGVPMGRVVVRIAEQPAKERYVGKYRMDDGSIKTLQLCTFAELAKLVGKSRSDSKKSIILEELYNSKQPESNKTPCSVSSWIDRFLSVIEADCTERTYKHYKISLDLLRAQKCQKFDYSCIVNLKNNLKSRMRLTSVNSHLRSVRRFAIWYAKQTSTTVVDVEMYKPTVKTIRAYSEEEITRLEAYCLEQLVKARVDRRAHYLFTLRAISFLRYTGLRGAELLHLKWRDVDLKTNRILITDDESRGHVVKGRAAKTIPIPEPLLCYIQDHCKDRDKDEYVLGWQWNSIHEFSRSMKRIQDKLGIQGIKPLHGFRAYYCTKLANSGRNALQIKRLMRHTSLETTKLYFDEAETDLDGAVNVW